MHAGIKVNHVSKRGHRMTYVNSVRVKPRNFLATSALFDVGCGSGHGNATVVLPCFAVKTARPDVGVAAPP